MVKLRVDEKPINFTYQEVAESLLKQAGIHEGLWGIRIGFGIGATNIATAPDQAYRPAAVVPITEIGIQRFAEPSNLTVDASVVNPRSKTRAKRRTPKKKA